MRKTTLFTLVLLFYLPSAFAQTPCSTPPSKQEMDKEFYNALSGWVKKQKVRLAIFPFQDGSRISHDPVLEEGFGIAMFDFLSLSPGMGVYHPFVVQNTVNSERLTSADYFSDEKILKASEQLDATHAIFGMFQKQPGNQLRYFIKIADVGQKKSVGTVLEFVTDEGDRFFESIAEASKKILGAMGEKPAKGFIRKQLEENPGFESFRFYVKGMTASNSYDSVSLAIAKVWFEKSASLSYTFKKANQEKARALLMISLIQKQMGKDFSIELGEAQQTLQFGKIAYEKRKKYATFPFNEPDRWLEGHLAYLSGLAFLQSNNTNKALEAFARAVTLIPEDGLSHYYLSTLYEKTGNQKANYEKNLARSINLCVR